MRRFIPFFLIFFSLQVQATPQWFWEDNFSKEEMRGLKEWVMHSEKGLTALFGPLPFEYRIFFYRRENGKNPVPWAETWKGVARDVYFHVDTSWSWQDFKADWTAPHELTHLIFPYIGDRGRWFAEGIASYLQYQVMYANNTITWPEAIVRLKDRFQHARSQGPIDMSIVDLSWVASEHQAYVRLYWGGAAYFMQADKRLFEEKDMRLNDVIREYMHCCNQGRGDSVNHLINTFDRLSGSTIFTETYEQTVMQSRFPETNAALTWLVDHPPEIRAEK